MVAGFTLTAHTIIGLGSVGAVIGAGGAATAQCAIANSDIGLILKTLEEIQKCLYALSQENADMLGHRSFLNNADEYSTKQQLQILTDKRKEFLKTLKKSQDEVNAGFKILKKI